MKQINSIEELRKAIQLSNNDFCIFNGLFRSSKYIECDDNIFYIVNEIDGSEQTLTDTELFDTEYTNIGEAIKKGTFYQY